MNASTASFAGSLVGWLADYYALATLLLLGCWLAWRWTGQPAHRRVIAWMLSGELIVLAVVCALPGWPRFSLIVAAPPPAAVELPAIVQPPLVDPPPPIIPQPELSQAPGDVSPADAAPSPAPPAFHWPRLTAAQWIAVGYLAGALLVGLWLAWGAVATALVRRRARPAGSALQTELSRLVPPAGRRPRLLVSPQVVHAVALGVLRPTIVLPAALAESSSPPTLRAVLSHEWAHIRHRDLWLLALGRLLLVALFSHPLYWWLRRAIRRDQELLADAVAAGENRQQYAEELLWAIRRAARPAKMTVSAALGIWEGPSELSRRIAMLLDETFRVEPTGSRRWRVQALAWLVLAGVACSLITLQPAPSTAQPAPAAAQKPAAGTKAAQPDATEAMKRQGGVRIILYSGPISGTADFVIYLPGCPRLMQRTVLRALDLTDEQKKKLQAISSAYGAASREFYRARRNLSVDALAKAHDQWNKEQEEPIRTQVEAVLTPQQSQALQRFALCEKACERLAYLDPKHAKKLGLTKEQQLKLFSFRKEADDRTVKDSKENENKMLAVLSPEQRTRLRAAALGPLGPDSYAEYAMKIPGRAEPVWVPSLYPYGEFSDAAVRKALKLTPEQQKRVREILGNHDTVGQALTAQWQQLPAAEREKSSRNQFFYTWAFTTDVGSSPSAEEKKRRAAFEGRLERERLKSRSQRENQPLVKKSIELRQQFEELLTPEQLAQYRDMAVQNSLGSSLRHPLMQSEIGLSDEQMAAIGRLQMESMENFQQLKRQTGEKMLNFLTPAQQEQFRAEIDRGTAAPASPPAKTKAASKPGQEYTYTVAVGSPGQVFHLVRGNGMSAGTHTPVMYDDHDKNFWMNWGDHSVVLPRPPQRYARGSIDLPAYEMLMQPSVQRKLNLTAEQKQRLRDISNRYWHARQKIADGQFASVASKNQKDLEELLKKSAKAKALAEGTAIKLGSGGSTGGPGPTFPREVLQQLEQQWQDARRQIDEVLTPAQLQMLKETTFRTFVFGTGTLLDPAIQGKLGMDQHERDAVRELDGRLQKEKRERLRNLTRERNERLLAVLTPEQRTRLHNLFFASKSAPQDYSSYPFPSFTSFARNGDDSPAKELGLSPAQWKQACDALSDIWKERIRLQNELREIPYDDEKALKRNGEKTLQLVPEGRKRLAAILTPAQLAAFEEMGFQNLLIPSLRVARKDTQEKLGLSDEQVKTLHRIDAEYVDRPAEIYGELTDKMLAALTPAQQQMLRAEIDRRGW
jgi:beta-lactamase regulating signal transducer with metallopeptidase domain